MLSDMLVTALAGLLTLVTRFRCNIKQFISKIPNTSRVKPIAVRRIADDLTGAPAIRN